MKYLIWPLLSVLVVSPGFVACEKRGEDQSIAPEVKSVASESAAEDLIKARLADDDQLKASNLRVEVDREKKLATLSGTLTSESLRTKAIELARSAQPELMIEDHIDVESREILRQDYTQDMAKEEWKKAKEFGEKVGNRIEDAWVHSKIVAKLIASSKTQARTIDVDVVNGKMTLRGTAQSAAQKSEAARVAKETEGVKNVDNQINIRA
jgi:osmotically-inducible protein OsmY